MFPPKVLSLLLVVGAVFVNTGSIGAAPDFASSLFAQRWQQDEQIVPNFWGPLATATDARAEPYSGERGCPKQVPTCVINDQGPGQRLVQYFDKGRMELHRDDLRGSIVTSGLLSRELITGQVQVGDTDFQTRAPAALPVAGDTTNTFPLYRDLGSGAATQTMTSLGTPVTLLLTPGGSRMIPQPQDAQTVVVQSDPQTGHGVPKGFADFRNRVGLANVGLALTDPFWADVPVAGIAQRLLMQAFERRVLTYNPANPAAFQVEFGNVGRHYFQWRYGTTAPAAPPTTDPVSPRATANPATGMRMVTLADYGQTITLLQGTSFVLSLGSDRDWQIQIADAAIVRRDPAATAPADSQGVYLATQAGQTTLTATGDLPCTRAVPRCLAPTRGFSVQIIVKQIPLPVPVTA